MEILNMEKSQNSLQRLNTVIEELVAAVQTQKQKYTQDIEIKNNKINNLQTEIQNLNNALSNRKSQLEELENKIKLLSAQLIEAQQRIEEQQSCGSEELQQTKSLLEDERKQKEEWINKYNESENNLQQSKNAINETTVQIDNVIARLEKVLEENGASNNND